MKEKNKDMVPYFCWDRKLTEQDIKDQLKNTTGPKKDQLIAWILREAAFRDVCGIIQHQRKFLIVYPGYRIL